MNREEKMRYYILELSDEQLIIVSQEELNKMQQDAEDFDGFEGWIIKGEFIPKSFK